MNIPKLKTKHLHRVVFCIIKTFELFLQLGNDKLWVLARG